MGIAYRAVPSVGCTFDVWDGEVTADQIRWYLIRLADDRNWPAGHAHLTDLTTVATASVPDPVVLDALYEGTGLADDLNVAVLVPAGVPTDVSLKYTTLTEELAARPFTELGPACVYLEIDEAGARVILDELRRRLHGPASRDSVD
ncbi:MAG: hypothetical protein JWM72_439 [Actinomycetia bacterium]|jgi:hypothetical protein|nr:hypothetical protein [Actinomycetes bacterium]MDQ1460524.1 hypothetical protein [Actinomycetota bacterium]